MMILFSSFVFQFSTVSSAAKETLGVMITLVIALYVINNLMGPVHAWYTKSKANQEERYKNRPTETIEIRLSGDIAMIDQTPRATNANTGTGTGTQVNLPTNHETGETGTDKI
jgi:hypothetical protein